VIPVPVHDHRRLEPAQDLERHVGRHRVDEHVTPAADPRRTDGVQHDDVEAFHAALVRIRLAYLELDLRIGRELLLEEEVAGADQEHPERTRGRDDGVGDVVRREVVHDVEPRAQHSASRVGEGQHDGAPHLRVEGQRLFGHHLAVERE
jgi:hypothetical protein